MPVDDLYQLTGTDVADSSWSMRRLRCRLAPGDMAARWRQAVNVLANPKQRRDYDRATGAAGQIADRVKARGQWSAVWALLVGIFALTTFLGVGENYGRLLGKHFAPDAAEYRTFHEEGSVSARFTSSSEAWESALNNWFITTLLPACLHGLLAWVGWKYLNTIAAQAVSWCRSLGIDDTPVRLLMWGFVIGLPVAELVFMSRYGGYFSL